MFCSTLSQQNRKNTRHPTLKTWLKWTTTFELGEDRTPLKNQVTVDTVLIVHVKHTW